jgi:RNA polymerase sigma-70 factor (family 1)
MRNIKTSNQLSFPVNMGNEQAFDTVFRLFYPQLCDFSERYLQNKVDAEEAVHNLFVLLWNKAEVFDSNEHLRAYLYRSAYNHCLNMIRSASRRMQREQIYGLNIDLSEESYLNNMLRAELISMIYREIAALPIHYEQVIKLSYQEGLKNDEIASVLGLSVQTVKNYKHKGLSLLKAKIPTEAWLSVSAIVLTSI